LKTFFYFQAQFCPLSNAWGCFFKYHQNLYSPQHKEVGPGITDMNIKSPHKWCF